MIFWRLWKGGDSKRPSPLMRIKRLVYYLAFMSFVVVSSSWSAIICLFLYRLWLYFHSDICMIMQIRLMCSYCKKHDETEVPDPYYGGPQGFEKVTVETSLLVWYLKCNILSAFLAPKFQKYTNLKCEAKMKWWWISLFRCSKSSKAGKSKLSLVVLPSLY